MQSTLTSIHQREQQINKDNKSNLSLKFAHSILKSIDWLKKIEGIDKKNELDHVCIVVYKTSLLMMQFLTLLSI